MSLLLLSAFFLLPAALANAAASPPPIATIVAGELVAGTLIWKGMQRVSDSAQTAAQTGVQPHRQAMQGYGMQLLGVTMGFSLPPIVISRQRGD